MRHAVRSTAVLGLAGIMVLSTGGVASAREWRTVDTDSLDRSTPSQKAWTSKGSFKWQIEKVRGQEPDSRATFSLRLHVDGARNSCARLRIITYKAPPINITYARSKRFPADSSKNFGYYTFCQADGRGWKTYSGSDFLDVRVGSFYSDIKKADVRICYSRKRTIAPGSDCYSFTANRGD